MRPVHLRQAADGRRLLFAPVGSPPCVQARARAGDATGAAAALALIPNDPMLIESAAYLNLTSVYRGDIAAGALLAAARADPGLDFCTLGYGIGHACFEA